MKKILTKLMSVLFAAIMIFGTVVLGVSDYECDSFSINASAVTSSGSCGQGVRWMVDNNHTLIISGNGAMFDYDHYNHSPAPWNHLSSYILAIKIEDGVTYIGDDAFLGIPNAYVYIAPSVKDMGTTPFYPILTGINFTGTLYEWCATDVYSRLPIKRDYLVIDGKALSGDVVIPGGITKIRDNLFRNEDKITSVTIPEGVTSIGQGAFYGCDSLTAVSIPKSVTTIGDALYFDSSSSNKSCDIYYSGNISDWLKISFVGSSVLKYSKDFYFNNILFNGNMIIPDGTTVIPSGPLKGFHQINQITIPESLTAIESGALNDCGSIKFFVDENNQNYSNDSKGSLYNKDQSVLIKIYHNRIPLNVTEFDAEAFYCCPGIIYYPGTYEQWKKIKKADNPGKGVKIILECDSKNPYYMPKSCSENLNWTLYTDGELVISGNGEMDNYESSYSKAPWSEEKITEVTIKDGVTSIGNYAFYNCSEIKTVTIEGDTTSIGEYAFSNCDSLTAVNMSDGVTTINQYAFSGCDGLETIELGCSVKTIGYSAFRNCSKLTSVTFPEALSTIDMWAFSDKTKIETICYEGTQDQYKEISVGPYNAGLTDNVIYECKLDVPYYDFGICGENLKWILTNEGELIISGDGKMTDYGSVDEAPWNKFSNRIQKLTIGKNVTSIGNNAFTDCNEIENVYYEGTTEGWKEFNIGTGNHIFNTANISIAQYKVIWVIDEKTESKYVQTGKKIELPTPQKTGYTFKGWSPEVPETMPATEMKFTAMFEVNEYNAVFDANGGIFDSYDQNEVINKKTKYGQQISAPNDPYRVGYMFAGWEPEVGIMDDINGKKFKAKWVLRDDVIYTVETYMMNPDGTYNKFEEEMTGTAFSVVKAETDVKEGFVLNEEKSVLECELNPNGERTLEVYYDRNNYKFTKMIDGQEGTVIYRYGEELNEVKAPVKEGYTFVGWSAEIPEKMPARDVTVEAKWKINVYNITWNVNGKEIITEVEYKGKVIPPEIPEIKGYKFIKWNDEIPEKMHAKNLVFNAILEPTFKISIRTPSVTTINYGDSIILHADVEGELPDGARIVWSTTNSYGIFTIVETSEDGKSCTVTPNSSGEVVFDVKVIDENGKTVALDTLNMTAKAGFFQKLAAFFKKLFGLTKVIPEAFKGMF